jgi:hypothetical protein
MARKDDKFPASRTMLARMEAIRDALVAVGRVVRMMRRHALPRLPEDIQEIVTAQLDEADLVLQLAHDAYRGE